MTFFRLVPPVLALLVAWALFIRNIGLESMWYDEHISWSLASSDTFADFLGRWPYGTGHPPFYFATLWAWLKWTGSVDMGIMRLTAALPSLVAVAFVYRLGREWFSGRWVGLAAMTLMGTNGVIIYFARELRMYGLLVLLVLVSWWLLRRFAERDDRRALFGYALTIVLMAYTHYLSAVVVLVQALSVLLFYRRRLPALLLGYALVALLVLPWLPTFIAQQEVASLRAGQPGAIGQFDANVPTTWNNIADFIIRYTAGQYSFAAALLILGLTLGLRPSHGQSYRRRVVITLMWLFVPVTLLLLVNLVIPLFNPRYVQWIVPALALLAGVAVQQMAPRARLPLLLFIGVSGAATHMGGFDTPKAPHRELLTTVEARLQPGDRVWYNLTYGALGSTTAEEIQYYRQLVVPGLRDEDFVWDAPKDFADPAVTRVWDVRPYWIPMPDEAARALSSRVETERYEYGAYTIRLYELPPEDDAPAAQLGELFSVVPPSEGRRAARAGESLTVTMWWRALQPVELDYSYVLLLRRESDGAIAGQWDGGLLIGDRPTSAWSPDDGYGHASVEIALPADLPPGEYTLWVGAYYWEEPVRLPVSADAGVQVDDEAQVARLFELGIDG